MFFGENELSRGSNGPEVKELQIRLAGLRGTIRDGDFGPGTELQIMTFQRDYMEMENPSGGRTMKPSKPLTGLPNCGTYFAGFLNNE